MPLAIYQRYLVLQALLLCSARIPSLKHCEMRTIISADAVLEYKVTKADEVQVHYQINSNALAAV